MRQQNSSIHDQQTRLHSVENQTVDISGDNNNLSEEVSFTKSSLFEGFAECGCGQFVKAGSFNARRIGIIKRSIHQNLQGSSPDSRNRHVCNSSKQETQQVLHIDRQPGSSGTRRLYSGLVDNQDGLRIPSTSSDSSYPVQVEEGREVSALPHSSTLADQELVQYSDEDSPENSTAEPSTRGSALEGNGKYETFSKFEIASDRISVINKGLDKSIPNFVKRKMLHNLRKSTQKQYQVLWSSFVKFVKDKVGHNRFSKYLVLEFFNKLIDSNNCLQSILCYRSALRKPILALFPDWDISQDILFNDLNRFVKSNFKKKESCFPPWDLDKVLGMLLNPPEGYINNSFLMQKSFFLALLACPKRISEFKALSLPRITFTENSVVLKPHQKFVKKNESCSFSPRDITIPSYPALSAICPVKNLQIYLRITNAICRERNVERPLELWIDENAKPLSLYKMRQWFRNIIFLSYPGASFPVTNFHSVRSQVASALDFRGISISTIIDQMGWASTTTFQRFYSKFNIISSKEAVLAGIKF